MGQAAGPHVVFPQGELALEHAERAGTQLDGSVLLGLRPVLVPAQHDHPTDLDGGFLNIALADAQRDLLGLAQAGEEAELIEIPHQLTPLGVNPQDEPLSLLDGEGVDTGTILLQDAKAV